MATTFKYGEGDVVFLLDITKIDDFTAGTNEEMRSIPIGTPLRIRRQIDWNDKRPAYKVDDNPWTWDERALSSVPPFVIPPVDIESVGAII